MPESGGPNYPLRGGEGFLPQLAVFSRQIYAPARTLASQMASSGDEGLRTHGDVHADGIQSGGRAIHIAPLTVPPSGADDAACLSSSPTPN